MVASEDDGKGRGGVTLSRAVCEGLGSLCFETDGNGKNEGMLFVSKMVGGLASIWKRRFRIARVVFYLGCGGWALGIINDMPISHRWGCGESVFVLAP